METGRYQNLDLSERGLLALKMWHMCDESGDVRFHGALCIAPGQGQGLRAPLETLHICLNSTRVTEWVG